MTLALNDLQLASYGTSSQGTVQNVARLWGSSAGTVIIPTSDTVTSGTTANTFTGYIRGITIVTPSMTATGTATLKLIDSKGGTSISIAQNEQVTAFTGTTSPMTTDMSWVCTANGTQAAAATVSFLVHYEK
jgi:hypothetical protein